MKYYEPITIKKFLSDIECDNILTKYLTERVLNTSTIKDGVVDKDIRKSSVTFIENIDSIDSRLKETLQNNVKIRGNSVTGLSKYQLTKYVLGDFYEWHTDSDDNNNKHRYCSIVIQLNDDYTGGNLQFKDENGDVHEFERGKGNLFIFFSNIIHRVLPVTDGVRYSLVNWVSLEKIDDYKKTLI